MTGTEDSQDSNQGERAKTLVMGLGLLAAAAALFGLCSAVQSAYGSSMFDSSYVDPGFVGGLLINLTFWPGWVGTVVLAGLGVLGIVGSFLKD